MGKAFFSPRAPIGFGDSRRKALAAFTSEPCAIARIGAAGFCLVSNFMRGFGGPRGGGSASFAAVVF